MDQEVGSGHYTHDAEGNLKSKTDRILGLVTTYIWDAAHRLRSVTLPNGSVQSFKYDPLGRKIESRSGSSSKRFVYGADQNIQAEFDGANAPVASYVFGTGLDTPLEMQRGGATQYFQQDALGSVQSLTSAAGSLTQQYQYGAFGQPAYNADSSGNPFTYSGREFESSTGEYFNRSRWNDSSAGRFTSEDSIPSLNSSIYASNSPTALLDPTGETSSMAELDTTMLTEDELQKWNAASHKNQIDAVHFYRFIDQTKNKLEYIGRTKDLLRRSAQHGQRVADDTLEELGNWAVSRTQARAIEQAFIRNAGGKRVLANEINAMAEAKTNQELIRIAQILIG